MAIQERITATGRQHITALGQAVRAAWASACQHEGMSPRTSFMVFSPDNPFLPFYECAQAELWAAQREYAAGGYVGLRIVRGRAR